MNKLELTTETRDEFKTIAIEAGAWDVLVEIKNKTGLPIKDIATRMILFANDHVVIGKGETND